MNIYIKYMKFKILLIISYFQGDYWVPRHGQRCSSHINPDHIRIPVRDCHQDHIDSHFKDRFYFTFKINFSFTNFFNLTKFF
jgi:hypothetical protein